MSAYPKRVGSSQAVSETPFLSATLIHNITTILITFLLAAPAIPIELIRYRGAAKDGGTLEYVFEAGEQNSGSNR